MAKAWYSLQTDPRNDSFHSQWEIFGIKDQSRPVRLTEPAVIEWLDIESEQSVEQVPFGRLRLLHVGKTFRGEYMLKEPRITRHRNHKTHDIKPWYMAFRKEVFQLLSEVMKLPSSYIYLRSQAGGSGCFTRHATLNDDSAVGNLAFVIRVPHSPRHAAKAVWSLAVSWNSKTGLTNVLFESLSDPDIQLLVDLLQGTRLRTGHPLRVPVILLDALVNFYGEQRQEFQKSLFILETQLSTTRGRRVTDVWDWDYDLYRETTKRCNGIYTNLVYLERRFDFAISLSEFLLESLTYCEEKSIFPFTYRHKLLLISEELRETVLNAQRFLKNQLHQVICLQKRNQALLSVIYIIITQKDSRTNVKIAKAAKQDSSSMTAIALLGIIYLPAMLTASMFSMSMFDFSVSNPADSPKSWVTPNFWVYWAVTIPLTLATLAVWKIWMDLQNRKSLKEDNVLRGNKMPALQGAIDENLASNTPLYLMRQGTSDGLQMFS